MLYNHGINSLQIMISPTVMKSPSITGPLIKYGKLSSAGERIGTISFSLCTLIYLSFCLLCFSPLLSFNWNNIYFFVLAFSFSPTPFVPFVFFFFTTPIKNWPCICSLGFCILGTVIQFLILWFFLFCWPLWVHAFLHEYWFIKTFLFCFLTSHNTITIVCTCYFYFIFNMNIIGRARVKHYAHGVYFLCNWHVLHINFGFQILFCHMTLLTNVSLNFEISWFEFEWNESV